MFLRRWRGLYEIKSDPEGSFHNPDTYSVHTERVIENDFFFVALEAANCYHA